jgi:hypothetical protein
MGKCPSKPGGKTVALICGSAVVGLLLLGVVGNMVDRASTELVGLQGAYYNNYADASLSYLDDLVLAQNSKDEVLGVTVPEGSLDDPTFSTTLEAAGLDSSRVIQTEDGTHVYLIASGDTLTSLSAAFGYSVDELANFNQIRNVNLIYANSALRIPID